MIWAYLLTAWVTIYLVRMLPIVFCRDIKSRFLKSFLYYVPYATLAAMTFPAILHISDNVFPGLVGLGVALLVAWRTENLFKVAVSSVAAALLTQLIINFIH